MIDIKKILAEKSIKDLLEFSIINIDKPSGPTSFAVDLIIKNSLDLKKTSHFGTLDPMVTGVLPVSLERACRLMPYFIGKTKTYVGVMRIHKDISENELKKQMKEFVGKITQLPPVKSRVKRQERQRQVYTFEIIEIDKKDSKNILFKAEVEAGTYIRKLVFNLGERIGGAHMLELRRIKASIFNEKESHTLFEILEAIEEYKKGNEKKLRDILIPGEIISQILPVIEINDKIYINKLYHGAPLFKVFLEKTLSHKNPGFLMFKEKTDKNNLNLKENDKIALFNKDNFIGVFKIINDEQILALPEFVLQPLSLSKNSLPKNI